MLVAGYVSLPRRKVSDLITFGLFLVETIRLLISLAARKEGQKGDREAIITSRLIISFQRSSSANSLDLKCLDGFNWPHSGWGVYLTDLAAVLTLQRHFVWSKYRPLCRNGAKLVKRGKIAKDGSVAKCGTTVNGSKRLLAAASRG